jgi:hypothetical protein
MLTTMAESGQDEATSGAAAEEDYMGDLSRFVSLETADPPKPLSKKVSFMPVLVPKKIK